MGSPGLNLRQLSNINQNMQPMSALYKIRLYISCNYLKCEQNYVFLSLSISLINLEVVTRCSCEVIIDYVRPVQDLCSSGPFGLTYQHPSQWLLIITLPFLNRSYRPSAPIRDLPNLFCTQYFNISILYKSRLISFFNLSISFPQLSFQ